MKNLVFVLFSAVLAAIAAAEEVRTRVSISSQPPGATVVIDGKDRGTTPITLFDLTPGRHHLKYRLAGYQERDRFINTDEGPFIERNEVLVEEKGLLLLRSDPPDCDIRIDGASVGRTPRLITNLPVRNTYSVRLAREGYLDHDFNVRFDGRTPVVREEKLIRASGSVVIASEPAGAEVTVNGIVRGRTPLTVEEVPKGRATVSFRLEGFAEEKRELAVNAGDEQHLSIALTALPGTLHLISVPDGARFYLDNVARGKGPVAIPGLKPGLYRVRAELEGYGTEEREIEIVSGSAAREEFRLSNMMGRLEVRTAPPGAQIFLDGRLVGMSKAIGESEEFSEIFAIENVPEGEHSLLVKAEGYAEASRRPKVRNSKTAHANVRMKRLFIPNVEVHTARGSYRGVLVSNTPEAVVVEVSLGITRSFPRDEIRKLDFLLDER